MTRKLAALLATQIVLGWVSPEALAQNDKTLERVQTLDVESLPGPVPTYYSPGARPRAEALQRRVRDAVSFFESRYGVPAPLSLAVLNESHWAALSKGPYGGMSASAAPPVVLLPAFPDRGVMAQFFRATHAAASSPEVRQAWASLAVSHEMAIPQVIDAMVFHEVGHVFVKGRSAFRGRNTGSTSSRPLTWRTSFSQQGTSDSQHVEGGVIGHRPSVQTIDAKPGRIQSAVPG